MRSNAFIHIGFVKKSDLTLVAGRLQESAHAFITTRKKKF